MIPGKSCQVLVALALIASVSFLLPSRTQACGPFFTNAIFVYSKHPDFPLENFAAGKLGVVEPNWARSYLVAAYRSLAGTSLSEGEAKGIKALWDERLGNGDGIHDQEWIKKWTDARKQVTGIAAAPEIDVYRSRDKPHEYESYLNCQQDAFDNAESTLDARIKRFGADSAAVRDWVAAQDIVFSNCRGGRQIPEAARSDQDPIIRADRAYQVAAANFYSTALDEAKQQFDSIARDTSSPWHEKAAYLAARAMLRKGSFAEKEEESRAALSDAENRLNAILKDNSVKASHQAGTRLLNLVRLRLHPEEKLHAIAKVLIKKDGSADFKQDVWDYTLLLDKFLGDGDDEADKKPAPSRLGSGSTVWVDPLTAWILALQEDSPGRLDLSIQAWERDHSLPWLVAAMTKVSGEHPKAESLLKAAANIDHSSPAFASLAFHSVRLLIETKRNNEARAILDKVLANDRKGLSPSAVNLLLSQRMTLAQDLDQFLRSAQRVPAGFSDDSDGREIPEEETAVKDTTKGAQIFLDLDAASVFNKLMPVAIIKDAAAEKTLASNLRKDVAQAAFLRAAMIDDRETANQVAPLFQDMYPESKPFVLAYQKATTPEARRFAAAFLSLKFPGFRPYVTAGIRRTDMTEIDSYRDNWWCVDLPMSMSGDASQGEDEEGKAKAKPVTPPEFLRPSQTAATRQFAALQALGTAPNYLCRIAIEWTEKNPADPRAPEALHLAVRSTRYGCTDKETGRWSKAAYDLLHRRYPNTTWARNTKYWFKG